MSGKFLLEKRGEVVGECVVLSEELVYFHLWDSITITRETTLGKIKKKYSLRPSAANKGEV